MAGRLGGQATVPGDDRSGSADVELDAVVSEEFAGQRVDRVVVSLLNQRAVRFAVSRVEVARWIRSGVLTVDGSSVKPKMQVRGGERIELSVARPPRFNWDAAQDVAFKLVHEDDSVIVIDKPAGLVVHPGAGNADGTLVNGLLRHRPQLASLPRAGLVHRLDKGTSGLLVVAANAASRMALGDALARHEVERRYLAVVEGQLIAAKRIDASIGRDPRNRLRQKVLETGRSAVTYAAPLRRFSNHTLVQANLETGRTHQIRVHLASVGHPLVGDRRYGARGVVPIGVSAERAAAVRAFPRQALHATRLAFVHPITGAELTFDSPLPDDMKALLAVMAPDSAVAPDL